MCLIVVHLPSYTYCLLPNTHRVVVYSLLNADQLLDSYSKVFAYCLIVVIYTSVI